MKELENLIHRFIDLKISKSKLVNVRDKEFALETLKKKIAEEEEWLKKSISSFNLKTLEGLHRTYLLGGDVVAILNSNKFYQKLSPLEYPLLFKASIKSIEKKVTFRDSFEMHHDPIIIDKQIPKVRMVFTKAFKKYLAFMELKKLIEKDGNKLFPVIQESGPLKKNIRNAKKEVNENNYSHRQIAIAYCIIGTSITTENASNILSAHSRTKSVDKLLTKRIFKTSVLTTLTENKSTDTKHFKDLMAAERLIKAMNNKKARTDISRIITAFETAYKSKY